MSAMCALFFVGAYFQAPHHTEAAIEAQFAGAALATPVATAGITARAVTRNSVNRVSAFAPRSSRASTVHVRAAADAEDAVVAVPISDRKFFVGGNWKCNGCAQELGELVSLLNAADVGAATEVAICPPSVYMKSVRDELRKDFNVCSQDVSLNDKGAFTGDIAADMLTDLDISHTLVGHSERRVIHGETSEQTAQKAKKALAQNVKVIACIGETLEEREADKTMDVLFEQLTPFKDMYDAEDWANTVIAYEPVWAIGTGKVATPQQAQDVHAGIRAWMSENVSSEVADAVRIIYGGSVNGGNANEIGTMADIDGYLVGGASLKPEFVDVINSDPANQAEA